MQPLGVTCEFGFVFVLVKNFALYLTDLFYFFLMAAVIITCCSLCMFEESLSLSSL